MSRFNPNTTRITQDSQGNYHAYDLDGNYRGAMDPAQAEVILQDVGPFETAAMGLARSAGDITRFFTGDTLLDPRTSQENRRWAAAAEQNPAGAWLGQNAEGFLPIPGKNALTRIPLGGVHELVTGDPTIPWYQRFALGAGLQGAGEAVSSVAGRVMNVLQGVRAENQAINTGRQRMIDQAEEQGLRLTPAMRTQDRGMKAHEAALESSKRNGEWVELKSLES